jgi:hypothetical protein
MKRLLRKLLQVKISAIAYFLPKQNGVKADDGFFDLRIFTVENKSGIKKIDNKLSSNNECYAVFVDGALAHVTWLFRKKLLTKQLGGKNVNSAGDSFTYNQYRGRGIYTHVLKTIAERANKDIIIYVDEDNFPSIKGIEKAGFKKRYSFTIWRLLGVKIWSRKYADKN